MEGILVPFKAAVQSKEAFYIPIISLSPSLSLVLFEACDWSTRISLVILLSSHQSHKGSLRSPTDLLTTLKSRKEDQTHQCHAQIKSVGTSSAWPWPHSCIKRYPYVPIAASVVHHGLCKNNQPCLLFGHKCGEVKMSDVSLCSVHIHFRTISYILPSNIFVDLLSELLFHFYFTNKDQPNKVQQRLGPSKIIESPPPSSTHTHTKE